MEEETQRRGGTLAGGLRRMHRLEKIADAIFIVAIIGMVVVCALITYTISASAR
jgi:hypothetical protein